MADGTRTGGYGVATPCSREAEARPTPNHTLTQPSSRHISVTSVSTLLLLLDLVRDHDDHVSELRPPGNTWAWRTMVIEYWQWSLLFRPLGFLGILPAEPTSSKAGQLVKEMINLALVSRPIFVHTSKDSLTCSKMLRHGADGFTSSEGRRVDDFYRPRQGLNPLTLGPMASTITITPPRTTSWEILLPVLCKYILMCSNPLSLPTSCKRLSHSSESNLLSTYIWTEI
jgi:hypothetical protein